MSAQVSSSSLRDFTDFKLHPSSVTDLLCVVCILEGIRPGCNFVVVAGPPAAASFDRPISALEDHEYMQRSTTDRASKEHSQPQSCMNVTEMLRMPHAPVQHRPQSRVQHSQMPSHAFPHSLQHATARPPPSVSPYVPEHAMLSHETMTQHVPCPIGQNSFMRHHGHPHIQGHATACPPSSEPL